MKKISILMAFMLMFSGVNAFASADRPLKNIGESLKQTAPAGSCPLSSVNNTDTKAVVPCNDCAPKTSDEVGKGIARFVGGLLKVAIFWCPEDRSASATSAAPAVAIVK